MRLKNGSRQKEIHLQNVPATSSSNSKHVCWVWGKVRILWKNGTRKLEVIKEKIQTSKIFHSGSSLEDELKRLFFFFFFCNDYVVCLLKDNPPDRMLQ